MSSPARDTRTSLAEAAPGPATGSARTLHQALVAEVHGRTDEALDTYRTCISEAEHEGDLDNLMRATWMAALLNREEGRLGDALDLLQSVNARGDVSARYTTATLALEIVADAPRHRARALSMEAPAVDGGDPVPLEVHCAYVRALTHAGQGAQARQRLRSLLATLGALDADDCAQLLDLSEEDVGETLRTEIVALIVDATEGLGIEAFDSATLTRLESAGALPDDLRTRVRASLDVQLEHVLGGASAGDDPRQTLRELGDLLDHTEHAGAERQAEVEARVAAMTRTVAQHPEKVDAQGEELLFNLGQRLLERGEGGRASALRLLDTAIERNERRTGQDSRATLAVQLKRLRTLSQFAGDRRQMLEELDALHARARGALGPHDDVVAAIQRRIEIYRWQTRPAWRRWAGKVRLALRRFFGE